MNTVSKCMSTQREPDKGKTDPHPCHPMPVVERSGEPFEWV